MAKQRPSSRGRAAAQRLAVVRPVLDRLVFAVALIGVLVTAHLYIQQERGFDRGCLGFSSPTAPSEGCAIVTQSEASTLFGIPNAIWGFGFYLVVVGLSIALAAAPVAKRPNLKRIRAGLIAFGVLYSGYLVYYQTAKIGTFCELCLTSAALVAILFVLQAVDYFTQPPVGAARPPAMPAGKKPRDVVVYGGLTAFMLVIIGIDFAYFNSLERASGSAGNLNFDTAGIVGADVECGYDPQVAPVADYQQLVSAIDPMKGNPDATVTVIEFFDPNCPHCATLYPVMEEVVRQYGDRARFVYKPFVLWQHSVAQSAALYAAAQEGKFFEMLELQFANQQQRGLSTEQLRAIAANIGLNPDVLMQRVQSGIYMSMLEMQRRQGVDIGINSVPAVLINGRLITTRSKTVDCMGRLISAQLSQ